MDKHIDFYFDFSSPYGYLASELIDTLASHHGYTVNWRPVLLGVIFKTVGNQTPISYPLKGEYTQRDFARSARYYSVPYRMPSRFPLPTQVAARAFYWLQDQNLEAAKTFAHLSFRALFREDADISDVKTVLALASASGADSDALAAVLETQEVKDRLRSEVETALARGVFGSPFFIVNNEPFWGADRLDQLSRWLETGGY